MVIIIIIFMNNFANCNRAMSRLSRKASASFVIYQATTLSAKLKYCRNNFLSISIHVMYVFFSNTGFQKSHQTGSQYVGLCLLLGLC